MHKSPRRGVHARTSGKLCKSPAMAKGQCRMHGGKSAGRPPIDGHYSKAAMKCYQEWRGALRALRELVKTIKQARR